MARAPTLRQRERSARAAAHSFNPAHSCLEGAPDISQPLDSFKIFTSVFGLREQKGIRLSA